jgi:hypothetical protein
VLAHARALQARACARLTTSRAFSIPQALAVRVVVVARKGLTPVREWCNLSPVETKQPTEIAHMTKLIETFRANPTDKNRAKLQQYIARHMMAVCIASKSDIEFLKTNGFKI